MTLRKDPRIALVPLGRPSAWAVPVLLTLGLGALAAPGTDAASGEPAADGPTADGAALYAEHCARCHGANGNGEGTAELDRPARSFLDGGYSYGNTLRAVERSVRHGIPGTPMPAFGETLDADGIRAVSNFVVALGPPGTIVEEGASVLGPEARVEIVHGMLPPLSEGERVAPRGVALGFPNGTTFAYDKAEGELLAVLTGDFVDRRDWRDRGGAALKLLGNVSYRPDDAARAAGAARRDGVALERRVHTVAASGADGARLDFDLRTADGERVGGGSEYLGFARVADVPVPVRFLSVTGSGASFAPLGGSALALVEAGGGREAEVRRAGAGLFAVDVPDVPSVRVLVHAEKWSTALGDALAGALGAESDGSNDDGSDDGEDA
ncbi:MAG: c-type cytochrome [Planctomycetota bacterium]